MVQVHAVMAYICWMMSISQLAPLRLMCVYQFSFMIHFKCYFGPIFHYVEIWYLNLFIVATAAVVVIELTTAPTD